MQPQKFMRITALSAALVAVSVPLAACGGGAGKPAHSASQACKDFSKWWVTQGGNVLAGKDRTLLTEAVSEAPSGHLYRDMSTFRSDVSSASAAQGSSLATGEKLLTLEAGQAVASDCQSVNPS